MLGGEAEILDLKTLDAAMKETGIEWIAGETPISALLSDLGDGDVFGLALSNDERDELFGAAAAAEADSGSFAAAAPLPESVDWRIGGWVTPVRFQSSCQACVAFALCASFESRVRIGKNDSALDLDLSEADLFFGGGRSCGTGWQFEPALIRSRDFGVGVEAAFPFTGGTEHAIQIPPAVRLTGWDSGTSVEARKNALVNNGPIIGGMDTYQDLSYYKSGVYEYVTGDSTGKHAICIVGYDDNADCWIVKNSWSDNWGEDGFLRIKYGECGLDASYPFYDPTVALLGII
jgi:C1A family cysteine protease